MDHTVNVLDHGLARLVSYTQPAVQSTQVYDGDILDLVGAEPLPSGQVLRASYDDWTGDLEIIRNARVSYAAAWRAGDDEGRDTKLINYLLKNQHWSPFESMHFTFEVKAPIFVLRQWHRHHSWRFNEVSARYSQLPEEFYIPVAASVGKQSKSNKQMREFVAAAGITAEDLQFIEDLQTHSEDGFRLYRKHLEAGVPRELARLFLGLNTYSHMFATVSLRDLMVFCSLRLHSHAQYEIRVYAEAMLKLIEPIVPVAVAAFKTHVLKEEPVVPRVVVGHMTNGKLHPMA